MTRCGLCRVDVAVRHLESHRAKCEASQRRISGRRCARCASGVHDRNHGQIGCLTTVGRRPNDLVCGCEIPGFGPLEARHARVLGLRTAVC